MHYALMRTHKQIITDAGGVSAVHADMASVVSQHTVRSWFQRENIPAEYFAYFAARGWASVDELALAAAVKKGVPTPDTQERAA